MKKYFSFIQIFIIFLYLIDCSTIHYGNNFNQNENTIHQGKALIIFYRPWILWGCAVSYEIYVNKNAINSLMNGVFFRYYTDPGDIDINFLNYDLSKDNKLLKIKVKDGSINYIKGIPISAGYIDLKVVSEQDAVSEIKYCNHLNNKIIGKYHNFRNCID